MYLYVRGSDSASSTIVSLDFQTIPTVWYFLFHIIYATLVYLIFYKYVINYYL